MEIDLLQTSLWLQRDPVWASAIDQLGKIRYCKTLKPLIAG
jgi:hypothetical protein